MSRPTEFNMNLVSEQTPTPQQYDIKCMNDGRVPMSEIQRMNDLQKQSRGTFGKDPRFQQYSKNAYKMSNPLLGPGTHKDQDNYKYFTKKACKTVIKGQEYYPAQQSTKDLVRGESSSLSRSRSRSIQRKQKNRAMSVSTNGSAEFSAGGFNSMKRDRREIERMKIYQGGGGIRYSSSKSRSKSRSPASMADFRRLSYSNRPEKEKAQYIQCTNLIQITPIKGDFDRRLNYIIYKQDSNLHKGQIDAVIKRKKLKKQSQIDISIRPSGYQSLVPTSVKRKITQFQEQPSIKEITKGNSRQLSTRIMAEMERERQRKYSNKRKQMHREMFGGGPIGFKKKSRRNVVEKQHSSDAELSQKMKNELIEQNLYDSNERKKKKLEETLGSEIIDERAVQITKFKFNDVQNTMQQQLSDGTMEPTPMMTGISQNTSPVKKSSQRSLQILDQPEATNTVVSNQDVLDIKCISQQAPSETMDEQRGFKEGTLTYGGDGMLSQQQPYQSSMHSSITFKNESGKSGKPPQIPPSLKSTQNQASKLRNRPMSAKNALSLSKTNALMKSMNRGGAQMGDKFSAKQSQRTYYTNQQYIIQEEEDNQANNQENSSSGGNNRVHFNIPKQAKNGQQQKFLKRFTSGKPSYSPSNKTLQMPKPYPLYEMSYPHDKLSQKQIMEGYKKVIQKTLGTQRSNSQRYKRRPQSGRFPLQQHSNQFITHKNSNSISKQLSMNQKSESSTKGANEQLSEAHSTNNLLVKNQIQSGRDDAAQYQSEYKATAAGPILKNARMINSSNKPLKQSLMSPILMQDSMKVQFEIANQQEQMRQRSISPKRGMPTTTLDTLVNKAQNIADKQIQKRAISRSIAINALNINKKVKSHRAVNIHTLPETQELQKFQKQKKQAQRQLQEMRANLEQAKKLDYGHSLEKIQENSSLQYSRATEGEITFNHEQGRHQSRGHRMMNVQKQLSSKRLTQRIKEITQNVPQTTDSLNLAHIYDPFMFPPPKQLVKKQGRRRIRKQSQIPPRVYRYIKENKGEHLDVQGLVNSANQLQQEANQIAFEAMTEEQRRQIECQYRTMDHQQQQENSSNAFYNIGSATDTNQQNQITSQEDQISKVSNSMGTIEFTARDNKMTDHSARRDQSQQSPSPDPVVSQPTSPSAASPEQASHVQEEVQVVSQLSASNTIQEQLEVQDKTASIKAPSVKTGSMLAEKLEQSMIMNEVQSPERGVNISGAGEVRRSQEVQRASGLVGKEEGQESAEKKIVTIDSQVDQGSQNMGDTFMKSEQKFTEIETSKGKDGTQTAQKQEDSGNQVDIQTSQQLKESSISQTQNTFINQPKDSSTNQTQIEVEETDEQNSAKIELQKNLATDSERESLTKSEMLERQRLLELQKKYEIMREQNSQSPQVTKKPLIAQNIEQQKTSQKKETNTIQSIIKEEAYQEEASNKNANDTWKDIQIEDQQFNTVPDTIDSCQKEDFENLNNTNKSIISQDKTSVLQKPEENLLYIEQNNEKSELEAEKQNSSLNQESKQENSANIEKLNESEGKVQQVEISKDQISNDQQQIESELKDKVLIDIHRPQKTPRDTDNTITTPRQQSNLSKTNSSQIRNRGSETDKTEDLGFDPKIQRQHPAKKVKLDLIVIHDENETDYQSPVKPDSAQLSKLSMNQTSSQQRDSNRYAAQNYTNPNTEHDFVVDHQQYQINADTHDGVNTEENNPSNNVQKELRYLNISAAGKTQGPGSRQSDYIVKNNNILSVAGKTEGNDLRKSDFQIKQNKPSLVGKTQGTESQESEHDIKNQFLSQAGKTHATVSQGSDGRAIQNKLQSVANRTQFTVSQQSDHIIQKQQQQSVANKTQITGSQQSDHIIQKQLLSVADKTQFTGSQQSDHVIQEDQQQIIERKSVITVSQISEEKVLQSRPISINNMTIGTVSKESDHVIQNQQPETNQNQEDTMSKNSQEKVVQQQQLSAANKTIGTVSQKSDKIINQIDNDRMIESGASDVIIDDPQQQIPIQQNQEQNSEFMNTMNTQQHDKFSSNIHKNSSNNDKFVDFNTDLDGQDNDIKDKTLQAKDMVTGTDHMEINKAVMYQIQYGSIGQSLESNELIKGAIINGDQTGRVSYTHKMLTPDSELLQLENQQRGQTQMIIKHGKEIPKAIYSSVESFKEPSILQEQSLPSHTITQTHNKVITHTTQPENNLDQSKEEGTISSSVKNKDGAAIDINAAERQYVNFNTGSMQSVDEEAPERGQQE